MEPDEKTGAGASSKTVGQMRLGELLIRQGLSTQVVL